MFKNHLDKNFIEFSGETDMLEARKKKKKKKRKSKYIFKTKVM